MFHSAVYKPKIGIFLLLLNKCIICVDIKIKNFLFTRFVIISIEKCTYSKYTYIVYVSIFYTNYLRLTLKSDCAHLAMMIGARFLMKMYSKKKKKPLLLFNSLLQNHIVNYNPQYYNLSCLLN